MAIHIENIDDVRRLQGIDDVVLRGEIAGVKKGDHVRVSISGDGRAFETVSVVITSHRGNAFRGRLTKKPRAIGLADVDVGETLAFGAEQIHSLINGQPALDSSSTARRPLVDQHDDEGLERPFFISPARPLQVKAAKAPKATKTTKTTKVRVAKTRKNILKVEADGARRFICVPAGRSNELHKYLRGQRIASAPPQPYYSDVDCIELNRSVDAVKVQDLLNAWS